MKKAICLLAPAAIVAGAWALQELPQGSLLAMAHQQPTKEDAKSGQTDTNVNDADVRPVKEQSDLGVNPDRADRDSDVTVGASPPRR